MEDLAKRPALGPYELSQELYYLTPPPFRRTSPAARTVAHPTAEAGQQPGKPKLLVRVREAIRMRQYSLRTEQAYVQWIRRYIFFHKLRHPADLGADEVRAYLSHLAMRRRVSASTQNQAFAALLFLYRLCGAPRNRYYVQPEVTGSRGGRIAFRRHLCAGDCT